MIVMFSGSRDYADLDSVKSVVAGVVTSGLVKEIIVGDARGVDQAVREAAANTEVTLTVYCADWNQYGRRAGIIRNLDMLDRRPDLVLAFWDGSSPGTRHVINHAKKHNIDLEVYK